jgi:hypothetical protein
MEYSGATRRQQPPGYYDVPTTTRYVLAVAYFGLAVLLAAGAGFSHVDVTGDLQSLHES